MLAKVLSLVFLVVMTALAVYIYTTREKTSINDAVKQRGQLEPRILLTNFEAVRYDGNRVVGRLVGQRAQLFDPNRILMNGDIQFNRVKNGKRQECKADFASMVLAVDRLSAIGSGNQTEVAEAELWGNVEMFDDPYVVKTDKVKYERSRDSVRSEYPVLVESLDRSLEMRGQRGFEYRLTDESFALTGGVAGFVKPNSVVVP